MTYSKPMGPLTGVLKQLQERGGVHYSIYWHLSNSIQFNRYKYLHIIITNITCNRELRFPFQLHPSLQQLTSSCLINRLAALSSKTYSTNWVNLHNFVLNSQLETQNMETALTAITMASPLDHMPTPIRAVARTLIGGGVFIHIFMFCPTSFFSNW